MLSRETYWNMNVWLPSVDTTWPSAVRGTAPTEPALRVWALVLATFGVGDGVTTAAIIWMSPAHSEANPVVRAAITNFGAGGLAGLKLLTIGVCLALSLWASTDDDQFMWYFPPLTLVLVGTMTTLINISLLW
ncbi:MAG: hypothetical protein A07HR67_02837 [uncultured archaeon A07HR67]|nr:MAG: hypothetical protein A07HR67_02837 [uncultured archaeon A07HR67]